MTDVIKGKNYVLLDKYIYDEEMVGSIVTVVDFEVNQKGVVHGMLSRGDVRTYHRYLDSDHWCLHFTYLDTILGEIK